MNIYFEPFNEDIWCFVPAAYISLYMN
jgi:hypothetical protein